MDNHHLKFAVSCGSVLALVVGCVAAYAQAIQFNIPSGSGGKSIPEFARQARVQVIGPGEALQSIVTPEINGTFDVNVALEMMLKGTDLMVSHSAEGIITISRREQETKPGGDPMLKGTKNSTSILALILGTIAVGPASAQDTTALETVVVTGTLIRGASPAAGSSLSTMSSKDIVATGATTTTELLRSTPLVGGFGATGNSVGQTQANYVDQPAIHGVGVGNGGGGLTLVLFDGHRLPGAGINQTAPDAGAIPPSALERVEIMDDGASSIYGSDAVAGVLNFILRKDYDGAQTSLLYGMGNGFHTWTASQLIGKTWNGGSFLFDFQHSQNSHLQAGKRSYISDNQAANGWGDNRSTTCSPANVTVGGTTYGLSASGVATAGVLNRCETNLQNDIYPAQHRDQGVLSVRQYVTPAVELYAEALFSYRPVDSIVGPQSNTVSNTGLSVTVPNTSPFYIPILGSTAAETVTYNPSNDVGVLHDRVTTTTFNPTIGANINLPHAWRVNIEGNFGLEDDVIREFGINQLYATDAAANGTLNPYGVGTANTAAVAAAVGDYQVLYTGRQTLQEGQIKADGPLFELPAGEVKAAVGADIRHEQFAAFTSTGPVHPSSLLSDAEARVSSASTVGNRTVYAFFGELAVPLIGEANSLPFAQKLDLSVSVRYDHYDTIGATTNPRVGIDWRPVNDVRVHGSYSTSFHAPSLADAGTAIDTRAIRFPDFTGSSNPAAYSVILAGGNSTLKPETSINYTGGLEWTPSRVPGLSMSVTYFRIDYKNVITFPTFGPVSQPSNPIYDSYRVYYPTLAQSLAMTAGFRHDGMFNVTTQLPTAIYDLRRQNFADELIDGLDFDTHYDFSTAYGDLTAGLAGTYLMTFDQQVHGASATQSLLNTNYAIDLKLRGRLSWTSGPFDGSLFVNYIDGYDNTNVGVNTGVDPFTTIDLHFGWKLPGEDLLSGMTLMLDGSNIFDADPPLFYNSSDNVSTSRGYDASSASALGRVISISLTKSW